MWIVFNRSKYGWSTYSLLPFDDVVGGCDVGDVDTVLVTAFVVVDTVCFVEPVDTIDEEGNVTGKDCVDWIRDTGGDDDDGCSTDDDCGSDGDGGDGVSCFDWFDANDDIDCDSCSDDDDPDATSVGDSDADGDSGGPFDDGASCVDCDCGKSDFDDGDGVGDGDVDVNADGSSDDVSSVDAAKGDVVADPDCSSDPDVAGDVNSNTIDVCATDFDALADANAEGSGDDENSVDSTSGDVVADPDG